MCELLSRGNFSMSLSHHFIRRPGSMAVCGGLTPEYLILRAPIAAFDGVRAYTQ